MQYEIIKSMNKSGALPFLKEGVFELPGDKPAFMWVHTCPTPSCLCRDALVMATYEGPDVLLAKGKSVHDAWQRRGHYRAVAKALENMIVFVLDIETAQTYQFAEDDKTDEEIENRIGFDLGKQVLIDDIASRITGRHLETFDEMWFHGKGKPTPQDQLLSSNHFSMKAWKTGDSLAWHDVFEPTRVDTYIVDGDAYKVVERYCPVPSCDCNELTVTFSYADDDNNNCLGELLVDLSGEIMEGVENSAYAPNLALIQTLWACYKARHQPLPERLLQRYLIMKELGKRLAAKGLIVPAPAISAKVGRNEPCPCGSGKKYKKCCAR